MRKVFITVLFLLIAVGCAPNLTSENPRERYRALSGLSDQAALAQIAMEDKAEIVRMEAVAKITDQNILAKIATDAKNGDIRLEAIKKITDENLLVDVALKDSDAAVTVQAVGRLKDQSLLVKLAGQDNVGHIRKEAVRKLDDQVLLTNFALTDTNPAVRIQAIQRLTDQKVLKEIANSREYRLCAAAVSRMQDTSSLRKHMGKGDACSAVADLRLALSEKAITSRLGNLVIDIDYGDLHQRYRHSRGGYDLVQGEVVTIKLVDRQQDILAKAIWRTDFPGEIQGSKPEIIRATVKIDHLLKVLFSSAKLSKDDLVEFSHSTHPIVRKSAVEQLENLY